MVPFKLSIIIASAKAVRWTSTSFLSSRLCSLSESVPSQTRDRCASACRPSCRHSHPYLSRGWDASVMAIPADGADSATSKSNRSTMRKSLAGVKTLGVRCRLGVCRGCVHVARFAYTPPFWKICRTHRPSLHKWRRHRVERPLCKCHRAHIGRCFTRVRIRNMIGEYLFQMSTRWLLTSLKSCLVDSAA